MGPRIAVESHPRGCFLPATLQSTAMAEIIRLGYSVNSAGGKDYYSLQRVDDEWMVWVILDRHARENPVRSSRVPQAQWAGISVEGKSLADAVRENTSAH